MAIVINSQRSNSQPSDTPLRFLGQDWPTLSDEELATAAVRVPELNTFFKMFDVDGFIEYGKPGFPPFKVFVRRDQHVSQNFYVHSTELLEKIVHLLISVQSNP